jgi:hypothetical protein
MDGGAVIVVLAVSPFAVLSLRAVVKSWCTLHTMPSNNFVIFLVSFPLYVKVAHLVHKCCGLVSAICFWGAVSFMTFVYITFIIM